MEAWLYLEMSFGEPCLASILRTGHRCHILPTLSTSPGPGSEQPVVLFYRLSPGPLGGISPFNRLAGHSVAAAARALGLHYLHRYFYLVTFACYLDMPSSRTTSFARWMSERRELKHLLHNLSLEVAT